MMEIPLRMALHPSLRKELVQAIRRGEIFIYPTDTIYGIGCNALHAKSVKKIKQMKKRDGKKPLSVIAPDKKWIRKNFLVRFPAYVKKLPGPYTLLLPKKKKTFLKNASASETVGVRIPKHEFTQLVREANVPFITTSVNFAGEKPIRHTKEIHPSFFAHVQWVIDDGALKGKPSKIYDLKGEKPRRIR